MRLISSTCNKVYKNSSMKKRRRMHSGGCNADALRSEALPPVFCRVWHIGFSFTWIHLLLESHSLTNVASGRICASMQNVFCFILYCNVISGALKQPALHFMFFALEKKNHEWDLWTFSVLSPRQRWDSIEQMKPDFCLQLECLDVSLEKKS